jgi:hypothetical protein
MRIRRFREVRSAIRSLAAAALLATAAACTPPPRPAPAPPPPAVPEPAPEAPAVEVWTRQAGVQLAAEAGTVTLPHAFIRLQVLQRDSAGMVVQCPRCPGAPIGRVDSARVVGKVRAPSEAAQLELADFALAVRAAALRRDYEALRAVMAVDFVHSLHAPEGALEAIGAWRGPRFNDLALLPALLDRGIVNVAGTPIWAAPPEYAAAPGFAGLRTGFRRGPGGWEWVFLVRPG